MLTIEDELHSELIGEFSTRAEAVAELARLKRTPWDALPNLAPCMSWQTCGRNYELVEWEGSRPMARTPALNISAAGVEWLLAESE